MSLIVLVDYEYLYENKTSTLVDEINSYYNAGDYVLIKVSYNWIAKYLRREDYRQLIAWLEEQGVKFTDLTINFQTNLSTDTWVNADVNIPELG